MKKTIVILTIIFTIILLILINLASAQNTCVYSGLKTEYGYNYQSAGAKAEYADEQFVHLVDSKSIKDLSQLKGLTCLEHGDFYNQGIIGDLENLKELIGLKVLSLHTNPEVKGDVCVFSQATKLKSLKLAFDEKVYGDISCLKDLNLETFAMTYAKISGDLSDLSGMTNLKALYLSGTDVQGDISALSGLTNLEELTLSDAERDGSNFYGDLASLDNLKKLRKVVIYNTKATNCEHFTEMHPGIEGGCSDASKSTVINTNVASGKLIGKDEGSPMDALQGEKGKGEEGKGEEGKDAPPEKCMKDQQFIGEEKCRAITGNSALQGEKGKGEEGKDAPPEECMIDQQFIGEEKCKAMVSKKAGLSDSKEPPEKCIIDGEFIGKDKCQEMMEQSGELPDGKTPEELQKKSFFGKIIGFFKRLFS